MVTVPAAFVEWQTAHGDAAVRAWLGTLPDLIERCCRRWSVRPTGEPAMHGAEAVVVPVGGAFGEAMLKVAVPAPAVDHEIAGLRAWNGRGVVALLETEPADHALLLERLDPSRTLHDLAAYDAAAIAGALIARLAIDPINGVPELSEIADTVAATAGRRNDALGRPVPRTVLASATAAARDFGATVDRRLVHADLHQGNVLAGRREPWLAIDVRTVVGDPEYSLPELMWCGCDGVDGDAGVRRLLASAVSAGGLDPERARGWVLVRCVDYWLWGLAHGLTEDPVRCARIIDALGMR